eukprot:gene23644-9173_t
MSPEKPAARPVHSLFKTGVIVFIWYLANILLLLLNKTLLSGKAKFREPCFLTLCHMSACVIVCWLVSLTGMLPAKPIKSRVQGLKIFALSLIFCATIVLGNASLKYIPVNFNQAIGATTPFFTAIFAFFCQGSREHWTTYLTLIPIASGVVITSGGEPLFHLFGFMLCLLATSGRALKTVVQSILMSDPSEKMDPMSLLLYMSLCSVGLLVPLTLFMEPEALNTTIALCRADSSFIWWLVGNSFLAYFVNLFNFLVTMYTSPLTLQVLGNAKGVVAAIVSVMVFSNPVTATGCIGYSITIGGVFLYSHVKRANLAKREQQQPTPHQSPLKQRLINSQGEASAHKYQPSASDFNEDLTGDFVMNIKYLAETPSFRFRVVDCSETTDQNPALDESIRHDTRRARQDTRDRLEELTFRVIFAPVDKVWEMLRSANMSWLDSVASVDVTGGDAEVGSLRKVSYKDGTVQTLKVVELSDLRYTITLDMIESEPAVSVMSKVQTLTLKRVTHDNTTFIEWFSDFSNDATQETPNSTLPRADSGHLNSCSGPSMRRMWGYRAAAGQILRERRNAEGSVAPWDAGYTIGCVSGSRAGGPP